MKHVLVSLVSTGGLLAWPPPGIAQGAADLSIQVGECIRLESAAERYACYERQVDDALQAGGTAPPGFTDPGRLDTEEEDLVAAVIDAEEAEGEAEEAEKPEQLISTIAALREALPNERVITLDNGQTWRQMSRQRYPLRVGHQVTIYPTRWGDSYRLTAEELNGFIQVERVR